MKRIALIAVALGLLALGAIAQTQAGNWLPIWNGAGYLFARLGPTLTIVNGELNAVQPVATPVKVRRYDKLLAWEPTTLAWTLPTGASNLAVHCNGLRYRVGVDYTVTSVGIKPIGSNMQSTFTVTLDYDE